MRPHRKPPQKAPSETVGSLALRVAPEEDLRQVLPLRHLLLVLRWVAGSRRAGALAV